MWKEPDLHQAPSESSRYPLAAYPLSEPHSYLDYLEIVRTERAKAMRAGFAALGRGVSTLVRRGVVAPIHRRLEREAAIHALRALGDHHLKDIGLTRAEIVAAVDGRLKPRSHADEAPPTASALASRPPAGRQGRAAKAGRRQPPPNRASAASARRNAASSGGERPAPARNSDDASHMREGRNAQAG